VISVARRINLEQQAKPTQAVRYSCKLVVSSGPLPCNSDCRSATHADGDSGSCRRRFRIVQPAGPEVAGEAAARFWDSLGGMSNGPLLYDKFRGVWKRRISGSPLSA
jgi:hypothetical protein